MTAILIFYYDDLWTCERQKVAFMEWNNMVQSFKATFSVEAEEMST